MIGLTGAHRTGKTTLAMAFAQRHGCLFVRTQASEVLQRAGYDPAGDYPFERRLVLQELLRAFEAQYQEAERRSKFWIADRTPLDLAAYLLADVQRETTRHAAHAIETDASEVGALVSGYVLRCFDLCQRHFSLIMHVSPAIELVAEQGKAPACAAYVEHISAITLGLLADERLKVPGYRLGRSVKMLDERVAKLEEALAEQIAEHKELRDALH